MGGEGAGKYLVGNLTTSRNVGTGSNNFGGIGVNIGSGLDNLGNVSITRISGTSGTVSANGNEGINRRWVISSASPPSSGRTISFSWVSSDDNGVILTEAWAFRSTDNGVTWNPEGLVQDVSSTRTITVITNSFSIWTVADESGPLPVELYSFTASQKGNDVILNWTTKTEVNNYGFEIEKAVGSKELEVGSWSKIGFVKGNGNSNSPKKYSFVDNKLTFGKYSYRLKQIDTDGGFEYSKVVEVNISVTDNFRLEQNYPNPFNPKTIIKYSIPFESNVTIKLHNILGETIQSLLNKFIQPGKYQLEFVADNLSSGIYIYSIEITGTNREVLQLYRKMILNK